MSSGRLHTPRDLQGVWDQLLSKESPEQVRPDVCTLLDASRECGTSCYGRNLWGNVIRMFAHSQRPPGSVGPVAPEGISRAMLSGRLHTPRHLQGVWDQLLQKESLGQCRPDVWTLPDTSKECGTSCSRRNLRGNVVRTSAHSQTPPGSVRPVAPEGISGAMSSGHLHTPRHLQGVWDQLLRKESLGQCRPDVWTLLDTSKECGTSCSGRNLRGNVVRTSAHSQTPPRSVGPVAPEGISGAMSSGRLHTPRHLQGVWDQLLRKESPEQCRPDVCTLQDTSRECGTSCSRRNLRSNVVRTSAHSQTPPGSEGPVAPEGISGAMSSGRLDTPRHIQGVRDQLLRKESLEQCHPDVCTLPDTSRECGTSCSRRNLQSNVIRTSAHSQTHPGSVGPVAPEGISGAMLSGRLHTPRHLQGVWDQLLRKESLEQCRPDVCTLPDTSRECGTSCSGRNLWSNVVRMSAHSQRPPGSVGPVALEGISGAMSSGRLHTPRGLQGVWDQLLWKESPGQCRPDVCTLPEASRECGTSCSGRNLRGNVVRTSAHSQRPPGSVGPVALEGISGAMSSGRLHTPRGLQGVWDQLLRKESPEQCRPDVCTLPDTSRECGTSCSGRNLRSNVVRTSAHSQTHPGSVGPVALEGISGAMSSGRLHTPRHLQGVWDQMLWKESPEQCRPDVCTLPDTSRECGTSCSGRNLWSNVVQTSAHSQTPPGSVGPVAPEGISGAMSSGHLHTPRHLQGVWAQLLQKESLEQCHPDVWTLPDTSRECGTSCSRRNLQGNVIRMSGHSQTPPGSVGPVAPEGISRAMSSGRLHTPRGLQGVWDQLLRKESLGQCRLDVCTLPDTSRECGTSCSRRNLWGNVVRMSAHSQTPPGSVGPVAPEGISGAMSSGPLHTPLCTNRAYHA